MNELAENPYKTPDAPLSNDSGDRGDNSIMKFKRFSAWWVFLLSIITFGIYPLYWMVSRTTTINTLHEQKIPTGLIVAMVAATVLSILSGLLDEENTTLLIISAVVNIAYMVLYLIVLYTMRNRLRDIMNRSSHSTYAIGPILTFFFSVIYFQYKINQCIDEVSGAG